MKAFSLKLLVTAAILLLYIPVNAQCFVDAGNDTTFCQQQGQLFATPLVSSPNYVYTWSPSTGLSNPNVQNPFVVSGVNNQTYVVTMLDTVAGCTNTDTVLVNAYYPVVDTFYSCFPDSFLLDFGPGATMYNWQYFIDTNNVSTFVNVNSQTYWATEPGQYFGYAMFTGCGALTALATVVDSCFTYNCSVDAGPDTTFCQQQGQLHATPTSPGNYSFSWSPATGLNNPFAQNPIVTSGVNNQQYVVTMTDIANNCISTDTVVVSAYYFHAYDTFNICQSSALLDFGPGASNYFWQFFTDTLGNTILINATTQTYYAPQPGTYSGYAVFPGCGALTSVFVVQDTCTNACTVSIGQQTISSSACGDTIQFTGSFTGTIGNWYWQVNNQYSNYGTGGIPQLNAYIGTGTYTITLTVYDPNTSCYATSSILVTGTSGIVPTINLIQVCSAAWNSQQFNPTVVPASNNYTYLWTPSTGLSDPTIRNPFVNGVYSQSYTLTVVDTVTGCVGMDTVTGIHVYNYTNDTSYICNNQPIVLNTYPAYPFFNYTWSTGQTTPSIMVNQPGVYTVVILTGLCANTSIYTVIDSCNAPTPNVWPGDCNYDLVVNMADALHVGLAYGATGATRPNASSLWYAQPMVDWSQSYANCNYKHGDADGSGTIDVNDTLPISQNYSLIHPYRVSAPQVEGSAPILKLDCTVDTVGLQTLVQVNVMLGDNTLPVDSLYGISFRITSDAGLIDTTLTMINASNSWLGNDGVDMFTFRKQFQNAAVVDFAEVRNDQTNRINGSGPIASYLIVTTDNLSGIAVCHFTISDVTAITASQAYKQFYTLSDSVVIDPSVPAGIVEPESPAQVNVYPNPANDQIIIESGCLAQVIEIYSIDGRMVARSNPNSMKTEFTLSNLADGAYFVKCTFESGSTISPFMISK